MSKPSIDLDLLEHNAKQMLSMVESQRKLRKDIVYHNGYEIPAPLIALGLLALDREANVHTFESIAKIFGISSSTIKVAKKRGGQWLDVFTILDGRRLAKEGEKTERINSHLKQQNEPDEW